MKLDLDDDVVAAAGSKRVGDGERAMAGMDDPNLARFIGRLLGEMDAHGLFFDPLPPLRFSKPPLSFSVTPNPHSNPILFRFPAIHPFPLLLQIARHRASISSVIFKKGLFGL